MKSFRYYILLTVILYPTVTSLGQETKFITPIKYTQNDGLSSYYITKIIKDSYGFLWIGTQEGLNLFDGNRFQTFTKRSPAKQKLKGSFISDLLEDKKRNCLWVLLSYGEVCAIDLQTRVVIRRISLDASNPDNVKWKRCLALKGDTLWIAGLDFAYAYHITKNKILPVDIRAKCNIGNGELNVSMIHFDHQQRMILCADGYGIIILDENLNHLRTFRTEELSAGSTNTKLRFWDAGKQKHILYIASSAGLKILNTALPELTLASVDTTLPVLHSEMLSIAASSDSSLMFSTSAGVYEYNLLEKKVTSFRDNNPADNLFTTTYDIYYDQQLHQAWLGTLAGIASFPTRVVHFRSFSEYGTRVKIKHLFSVLPVSENVVYAGDENGIYYVDTYTGEIEQINDAGSNLMLFQDAAHHVFVSNKKGFHIIEGKKLIPACEVFPSMKLLDSDHLSCGIQYNDSLVLFGSIIQKGLTIWNTRTGKLQVYHRQSVGHTIEGLTIINYLYKTRSGDVMILTEKSVIAFNPLTGKYTTHTIRDNLTQEVISNFMDMCETDDHFYIATYGDGLIETDKQLRVKKIIRSEDGLNNTCIYRVFPYQNKSILVTTNEGLSMIYLNPLKIKNYFQTDGLNTNAFEQLCGYQDDHRIIAGGVDGFTIINPALLPSNARPPDLYFGKLKVNTKSGVIDTSNLTLEKMVIPSDVLQTAVSFSALNFSNPKEVRYAYKINELDNHWIDLGKQNFVDLIGLSPGDYTLQVRAANEDGIWSEPRAMGLIYIPKWYQTNLFKFVIVLMGAACIYGLLRYRIDQLRKQQEIRKQIGNDLHDDIGSILNSLKIFTHLAKREPENKSHLGQIEESITQATTSLRDMIWVLEEPEDTIFELMERIKKFALPVCVANQVELHVTISSDKKTKVLLKTEKRNLLLLAKETINNSIKYAHGKNISVSLTQTGHAMRLKISDDGVGFDLHKVTYGKGLKSIQFRARQINFTSEIISIPGKGTSVEIWRD
ncbi:MAG TPA: triple tyrosine motif-containing protein [Ohtaekwangia sp.]|uniref:sensor histidine kinase n=1 Tax=Ohtaekwangia sp. TaxID=2066019 RepID=UPI002F92994A